MNICCRSVQIIFIVLNICRRCEEIIYMLFNMQNVCERIIFIDPLAGVVLLSPVRDNRLVEKWQQANKCRRRDRESQRSAVPKALLPDILIFLPIYCLYEALNVC
jgi:hypothetical protein